MSYVVDMSKSQSLLVKELFNHFNGSSYNTDHLSLTGTPVPQEGAYNTYQNIVIAPLPDGVDIGTATIHYNRIDIATLFSVVEVKLREVDIKADGSYDETLVLAEIQRKYGIDTSTGHFGTKVLEGQDVFYAKSTNPAFIGYSPLVVEVSLETRIQDRELNGFMLRSDVVFEDVWIVHTSTVPHELGGAGNTADIIGDHVYVARGRVFKRMSLLSGDWETMSAPSSLGEHLRSVVYNGDWYVFGGRYGDNNRALRKYDPVANSWSVVTNLFVGLIQPTAAVVGDTLYYYGGWTGSTRRENKLYSYNFVTQTHTEHGQRGQGAQGAAMVAIGGILYIYGGYSNGIHGQFLRFDTSTQTWLPDDVGPKANTNHSAVAVGTDMYVMGGNTAGNELYRYDTLTDTWELRTNLPSSVYSAVLVYDEARARLLYMSGIHNGASSGRILEYY